jgi:hypothetical protein
MKGVFVLPAERVSSPPLPPFLLLDTEAANAFPIGGRSFGLERWNRACAFSCDTDMLLVGVATAYLFVSAEA